MESDIKSNNPKVLAIFDFDGTITKRDTLPDFLLFSFGWKKFLLRLPLIIYMKTVSCLGMLSSDQAKEKVLKSFLQGIRKNDLIRMGENYKHQINKIVRSDAIFEIIKHQQAGHKVIIISASIYEWIAPWAKERNIELVLSTEMEVYNDLLSGYFSTPNCKGIEKVSRLKQAYPDFKNYTIYVYGDSSGDKELLKIANYTYYKSFR